jgi:hypothetical protein
MMHSKTIVGISGATISYRQSHIDNLVVAIGVSGQTRQGRRSAEGVRSRQTEVHWYIEVKCEVIR